MSGQLKMLRLLKEEGKTLSQVLFKSDSWVEVHFAWSARVTRVKIAIPRVD